MTKLSQAIEDLRKFVGDNEDWPLAEQQRELLRCVTINDVLDQVQKLVKKHEGESANITQYLSGLKVIYSPFVNKGNVMVNKEEFENLSQDNSNKE